MKYTLLNEFKENYLNVDLKTALFYCGFNLIKVIHPLDEETHKIKISNKRNIKDLSQLLSQTNLAFNSLNFSYDQNYVYLTLNIKTTGVKNENRK